MERGIIHFMCFWLKNKADYQKLKDAVDSLAGAPQLADLRSGRPDSSGGPVMDASFDLGVVVTFRSREDLDEFMASEAHVNAGRVFAETTAAVRGYAPEHAAPHVAFCVRAGESPVC